MLVTQQFGTPRQGSSPKTTLGSAGLPGHLFGSHPYRELESLCWEVQWPLHLHTRTCLAHTLHIVGTV